MTKETYLQKLERLERDGPIQSPPPLSEPDRRRIAGAARQWSTKAFKPFDYSRSPASDEVE